MIAKEKIDEMAAIACEIVGTGDGKQKNSNKNEGAASKTIANDLVLEIIDNALEMVDDTSDVTSEDIMDQNPMNKYKEKHLVDVPSSKEKPVAALKGTGDQGSNVDLESHEPVFYHPPVEKKNRLTDLVKNSKQILARIMMSDSKSLIQGEKKEEESRKDGENEEEKTEEEKVVEVIELECVQISDLPFKSRVKVQPEEVPLPDNDSHASLTPSAEESMDEVGLGTSSETKEPNRRTMTFPRASGSRAKAAFAAKCRTLKMSATNLKKKKWDVSGKIANFFRKKRESRNKSTKSSEEAKRDDGCGEVKESFKE